MRIRDYNERIECDLWTHSPIKFSRPANLTTYTIWSLFSLHVEPAPRTVARPSLSSSLQSHQLHSFKTCSTLEVYLLWNQFSSSFRQPHPVHFSPTSFSVSVQFKTICVVSHLVVSELFWAISHNNMVFSKRYWWLQWSTQSFLADRTDGRAVSTVLRPSVVVVVCLYGRYCG